MNSILSILAFLTVVAVITAFGSTISTYLYGQIHKEKKTNITVKIDDTSITINNLSREKADNLAEQFKGLHPKITDKEEPIKKVEQLSRLPNTELVISMARRVVEQVAPDELRLFPAISLAYAKEPGRILKQQAVLDKPPGFGPGELNPVLTITILSIVQQTLDQFTADAAQESVGTLLHNLRKAMFKRFSSSKREHTPSPPGFNSAELILIKTHIYQAARQQKFTDANAQQFANIVVGRLATMKTETEKI